MSCTDWVGVEVGTVSGSKKPCLREYFWPHSRPQGLEKKWSRGLGLFSVVLRWGLIMLVSKP